MFGMPNYFTVNTNLMAIQSYLLNHHLLHYCRHLLVVLLFLLDTHLVVQIIQKDLLVHAIRNSNHDAHLYWKEQIWKKNTHLIRNDFPSFCSSFFFYVTVVHVNNNHALLCLRMIAFISMREKIDEEIERK